MNIKYLLLPLLVFFIVSCSSDDDSGNNTSAYDFFPMNDGNYWVYNVESEDFSGRDSVYVANDTVINNKTYKKFRTDEPPYGFYSNSLKNNAVRKSGNKLLLSGALSFDFGTGLPLNFSVADMVLLEESAAANSQLSSLSGSFQQQVEGFTIDFDYTIGTKAKQDLETYTVPGHQEYTNVKVIEVVLNLTATVNTGVLSFPLLPAQNVIVSTQYYAQDIGVVHVVTDFNYQLADTFGFEVPIPENGSQHTEEVLVNYNAQ